MNMINRKLTVGILLSLIVGAGIGYTAFYKEISDLRIKNSQLETRIINLQNQINKLKGDYDNLNSSYYSYMANHAYTNSEYEALLQDYNRLKEAYRTLKNSGLIFDGLNITDLKIIEGWRNSVVGNVTNVSNESMPTVYVVLFTYDANGTLDGYYVKTIENLAAGEIGPFEFYGVLRGNQTFRIMAVGNYGLTDIEAGEVAHLLARIEELKAEVGKLKAWQVHVLTDREYYYSIIEDIRRANESILVAMYSMIYDPDDAFDWANDLIRELVHAKERGVNVTVIIEYRTYWGYMDDNLEAYNYLLAHNVTVRLDEDRDTDHMKLVIIDDKIVYIGSHNWSESALYYNHETSVKIVSREIAEKLKAYFGTI